MYRRNGYGELQYYIDSIFISTCLPLLLRVQECENEEGGVRWRELALPNNVRLVLAGYVVWAEARKYIS